MVFPDTERSIRYRDMTTLEESLIAQSAPFNKQRNALIETLRGYRFNSALEIGCSVGTVIGRIAAEFEGVECAGFDFNRQAIMHARQTNPAVDFRVLDAEDMRDSYAVHQFDLIFTSGVLMHCGPRLFRGVGRGIVAMKPKIVVHHEPQGDEELLRQLSYGKILEMSKRDDEPMPGTDKAATIYLQRRHDYVGFYRAAGVAEERILYDASKPVLSQCAEVIVLFDPEAAHG